MVLSGKKGWAVNIPLLLIALSLTCAGGAIAALTEEINAKHIGGAVLALGLAAFTASELRWIWVEGTDVVIRSPYGETRLPLQCVALGINVHHGTRGGPSYTIYAESSGRKKDVAGALTRKGAERVRERLTRDLLGGRLPTQQANKNAAAVAQHEAKQQAQSDQAQQVVQNYYKNGGHRQALWIVLGLLALNMLIMGAVFWWRSR